MVKTMIETHRWLQMGMCWRDRNKQTRCLNVGPSHWLGDAWIPAWRSPAVRVGEGLLGTVGVPSIPQACRALRSVSVTHLGFFLGVRPAGENSRVIPLTSYKDGFRDRLVQMPLLILPFWALWHWEHSLTSLRLSFSICKMRLIWRPLP